MIWIVSFLLAFTALQAGAQSSMDGVLINADSMYRDLEKRMVRLEGHVQVVFQGQHLSCRKAEIDLKKEQITAEGNVILYNERVHVEGDRVVFNYKQNTGYIYNGFVQSGQVVFEGDVVQKIGEDHYLASNASFTACETCPPGWSFSGRTIDAEIGGYARIRRPVFRVGGIPIMILPGLIVPLKSARQSGFLVPSFEVSQRGGAALGESYFWAIDRSQDLTFTVKGYQKRGAKLHGDYRYVLAEKSQGRLQGAWIEDRRFKKELTLNEDFDRWFLWYSHRLDMPENYVSRMDIKTLSDLKYPRDFPTEITGHGDPALENRMSLAKSTDNQFMSGEVDIYTNLLKTYPLSPNEDAVHRFPELRYALKEQSFMDTGLFYNLDVNYVNFARQRYNYDDMNPSDPAQPARHLGPHGEVIRDGQFTLYDSNGNRKDIFRTGQRLDVRPSISYPFQIYRAIDVLPLVSFRETQYRFYPTEGAEQQGFIPTAARRYVQTDLRMRTEFSHVYGSKEANGERWKHAIEPEVGYSHIPWMRRPNHPFFGDYEGLQYSRQFDPISDNDIRNRNTGIQFDYQDRTYEKQVVDLGLTNTLTKKVWLNGEPDYKTKAIFRLSQSYDMNEARATRTPHPWSSVNGLADLRFDHFETYTTAQYNGYAQVTNLSSRVKFMRTPKDFLQLSYTRNFILDEDYSIVENGETRSFALGAGFITNWLEAQGQFEYEARTWKLQSFTYALNIRPPGRCWLIKFQHHQVVGGDPSIHGGINFDFGGEGKTSLF